VNNNEEILRSCNWIPEAVQFTSPYVNSSVQQGDRYLHFPFPKSIKVWQYTVIRDPRESVTHGKKIYFESRIPVGHGQRGSYRAAGNSQIQRWRRLPTPNLVNSWGFSQEFSCEESTRVHRMVGNSSTVGIARSRDAYQDIMRRIHKSSPNGTEFQYSRNS